MINSCLPLETILTKLLTETPYARALILKGTLKEVHTEKVRQCLASVDFLIAKLKREEAEKQEQAAIRLTKPTHEIKMRKKELKIQMEQMALQELEEDNRQRVAAVILDEAELKDNRSLFVLK